MTDRPISGISFSFFTYAPIALFRHRPAALLWSLLGGSASIFLAGMGIVFDLQDRTSSAESINPIGMVIDAAINMLALSLGALAIQQAWARRRWFVAWERP